MRLIEARPSRRALLSALTEKFPDWVVWKHVDAALRGVGDIDSALPREQWDGATEQVAEWWLDGARQATVVVCDHLPDVRLALCFDQLPAVEEIDFATSCSRQGSRIAVAERLVECAEVSPAGIRQLTPGAEAFALSLIYGLQRDGTFRLPDRDVDVVSAGIERDEHGFLCAAELLVPWFSRRAATKFAKSIASGHDVDGRELLASLRLGALSSPVFAVSRVCARVRRRCPIVEVALGGREVPLSRRSALLEIAAGDHRIIGDPALGGA